MKTKTMKTNFKILNLLTWATLVLSTPAQAANLEFDDSWEIFGDVQASSPSQANLSTDGLFFDDTDLGGNNGDFNFSGNPAGFVGFVSPDLSEFLEITVDQLDIGGFAYEGSAIKQTINVNAGDKLKFSWNFLTNETFLDTDPLRGSFIDYSFLLVDNQMIPLADINDATLNSASIFDQETGLQNYEYTFNNGGTYKIALGLVEIDDFAVTSALTVENIRLEKSNIVTQPIPEPGTILGIALVGGFSVLLKNEGSKRKKNPHT